MNKLPERLKELRLENNLTLKQIAEKLSIPLQTYAGYEHGTRQPPIELLITICDYYEISADFLIGRTNNY